MYVYTKISFLGQGFYKLEPKRGNSTGSLGAAPHPEKSKKSIGLQHTAAENHMPLLWDHTVLPATRQRWLSRLTPAEAGTRFSDPGGMPGWVNVGGGYNSQDSLHATDGHLSQK